MSIIKKSVSMPLYLQVANWMREKIYSNEWRVDQQIPTEKLLQSTLQVSRGTVKKGINVLIEEELLIQIQGRGTFVANQQISHPLGGGLLSFAESLKQQKIDFKTRVVKQELMEDIEMVQTMLNIDEHTNVLNMVRVRSINDEPIMLMENKINLDICIGLEKVDFNVESLFRQIEKTSGKKIKYSESRYAARSLNESRSLLLEIEPGSSSLHLEQRVFLEDNKIVEWGNVWLKSNKYVVGTVLQRY